MAMASEEEVKAFLAETKFEEYMSVPLPHGLSTPGRSRLGASKTIFSGGIEGKSLLDVGTNYGFYPYEAMRRGAARAEGVEIDADRYAVAQRISELNGGNYRVHHGRAEDMSFDERFDLVLFLNVLHHVLDPVEAVSNLASLSRDRMIIEFCLTSDPVLLSRLREPTREPGILARIEGRLYSLVIRALQSRIPLLAVGNAEYHRTWYFSPQGFHNLFVVQYKIFESVEFRPGVSSPNRMLAFCRVPR